MEKPEQTVWLIQYLGCLDQARIETNLKKGSCNAIEQLYPVDSSAMMEMSESLLCSIETISSVWLLSS